MSKKHGHNEDIFRAHGEAPSKAENVIKYVFRIVQAAFILLLALVLAEIGLNAYDRSMNPETILNSCIFAKGDTHILGVDCTNSIPDHATAFAIQVFGDEMSKADYNKLIMVTESNVEITERKPSGAESTRKYPAFLKLEQPITVSRLELGDGFRAGDDELVMGYCYNISGSIALNGAAENSDESLSQSDVFEKNSTLVLSVRFNNELPPGMKYIVKYAKCPRSILRGTLLHRLLAPVLKN